MLDAALGYTTEVMAVMLKPSWASYGAPGGSPRSKGPHIPLAGLSPSWRL
jgi:hypothetical protein